jgi:rhamnulokinase
MNHTANFVAADLGASSGRVMAGLWNGHKFSLEELHRFSNFGVRACGSLHWNVLGIWAQIQEGLGKYRSRFSDVPQGIGVDGWGVDFALLDRCGRLLGNPFSYRDGRTDGIPRLVFDKISEADVFSQTGVQTMQINTLFQLYSMVHARDPQLDSASTLLMLPDFFLYLLSGERLTEHSEASTSQMYSLAGRTWARGMLDSLGIPVAILPEVVQPGTVLGPVHRDVLLDARFSAPFPAIAVASHDTACAVAAIPNMDRDSAFISSGTWSLMGVELEKPDTSSRALGLKLTNEGGAGGAALLQRNLTGLWVVQECLRQWEKEGQRYTWDDLILAASEAGPAQAHIDPNAKEFQAPGDMPHAIREYCSTTNQPKPQTVGAIARCALESLCLTYRSVLQSLEAATSRRLPTIRVVGGGSLNRFLCQMVADCCDRQVVSGPVEASAFGNVMLQAIATGHLPDVHAGRAAIANSVEANRFAPHRSDAWDEAFARFKAFEVQQERNQIQAHG